MYFYSIFTANTVLETQNSKTHSSVNCFHNRTRCFKLFSFGENKSVSTHCHLRRRSMVQVLSGCSSHIFVLYSRYNKSQGPKIAVWPFYHISLALYVQTVNFRDAKALSPRAEKRGDSRRM